MKHILTVLLLVLGTSCIHKKPIQAIADKRDSIDYSKISAYDTSPVSSKIVITRSGKAETSPYYYVQGTTDAVTPIKEMCWYVPMDSNSEVFTSTRIIHQQDGIFEDSFIGSESKPLAYVKYSFTQPPYTDTVSIIVR